MTRGAAFGPPFFLEPILSPKWRRANPCAGYSGSGRAGAPRNRQTDCSVAPLKRRRPRLRDWMKHGALREKKPEVSLVRLTMAARTQASPLFVCWLVRFPSLIACYACRAGGPALPGGARPSPRKARGVRSGMKSVALTRAMFL